MILTKMTDISLAELKNQMPYTQWAMSLAQARINYKVGDNELEVLLPNELAVSFTKNRLYALISNHITDQLGFAPLLTIKLDDGPAPAPAPADRPAPAPANDLAAIDWRAWYSNTGYIEVSHYANRFWRAYLGKAFALWQALQADPISEDPSQSPWTKPKKHHFRKLSERTGLAFNTIKGAKANCFRCAQANTFEMPLEACCNAYQDKEWTIGEDTLPRCYHWREGALEVLSRENLISVEITKADNPRQHALYIQTWRILPILTPRQTSQLKESVEREHTRWLNERLPIMGLSSLDWEQDERRSLVRWMPGWTERELTGQYQPNPFCFQVDANKDADCFQVDAEE